MSEDLWAFFTQDPVDV